jgi:hypothetical protein
MEIKNERIDDVCVTIMAEIKTEPQMRPSYTDILVFFNVKMTFLRVKEM